MHKIINKRNIEIGIVGIIYIVISCFLSYLFIINLGNLLSFFNIKTLDTIFKQLSEAKIFIPFYIPTIFYIVSFLIYRNTKIIKAIKIVLYILFFFISVFLSILFSIVNDIMFIKVVVSLLNVLGSGEVNL